MEIFSGTDLLETFNSLGINTGNVSKLTIDSWFDTDCEATKEMLNWLCANLTKDNVLTAQENEEYEQLVESGLFLTGKPYEKAVTQLQEAHPGILEYDKNVFEVSCMEEELETLVDEERELDELMNLNRALDQKLSREINKVSEEELKSKIQMKAAQQKCLELSSKLDKIHEKLQRQLNRYAEHLNESEHSSPPLFISSNPTSKYDHYCTDVVSYAGIFNRREYEVLPTAVTAKKKLLQGSSLSMNSAVDDLEVLRQRICKSVQNYLRAQVTEERLKAEIEFLKAVNVSDILSDTSQNDSFQFMLEANVLSKEELLKQAYLNIESIAQRISDSFVERPKITCVENRMALNQKKLESVTHTDRKVTEILAKHILLYLLLEKEKADVQSTDKFFRDVHYYITHNLHSCQLRTDAMTKVINDYYLHKSIPLEQKFKLVKVVKALLTNSDDKNVDDASAVDIINNFIYESSQIEHQVFIDDYLTHRQFSRQIEQQIEVMQKFLISGPTNQMIVIPQQLFNRFNEMKELLKAQATMLQSSVQCRSDAEKKLSESKWFNIRRQLWMWFLLEPQKILFAIDRINMAVKQQ